MDIVSDTFATEDPLTPRPVKKVKAAVSRKMKLEDIEIMKLYRNKDQKRNDKAALDVQIRLVRDIVRSEVREIKSDIMKEVDEKF